MRQLTAVVILATSDADGVWRIADYDLKPQ